MSKIIKINLLPRTVNAKVVVRNTALVFAVLFVAIVAGGFTYTSHLRNSVEEWKAAADQKEQWEARVKSIEGQASQLRSSIKPIQDKLAFIDAVLAYNNQYPDLYGEIAKWTYERVMYSSMACDNGSEVKITAMAKTVDDVGRYLLNLYNATDLFSEVSISGIPGYPNNNTTSYTQNASNNLPQFNAGGQIGGSQAELAGIGAISRGIQKAPDLKLPINIDVTLRLKNPIQPPSFAGSAAGAEAGGGGFDGAPGMPPDMAPDMPPSNMPGS